MLTRLTLLLFIAFYSISVHALDEPPTVHWGYKGNMGPEKWSELSPNFALCAKGKAQSPINIIKKVNVTPSTLKINYTKAPLTIVKDGQTQIKIGNQQTLIQDGHNIQTNFASQSNETITFENKTYRLIQFSIHTPSEHEWHGQTYPMELHFVHQNDNGDILIIGVFAKGGKQNVELQKILDHLPNEIGKEETISGEMIDPSQLLPINQDYYSYIGSLTVPPCLEGVKWLVMANPITVSPPQMVMFRRAVGGNNARPVQALHGRTIYFSSASS